MAVGRRVSSGAIWVSPDGRTWDLAATIPIVAPGGGVEINAVAAQGSRLVAVGRDWHSEGTSSPGIWTATDLDSWDRILRGAPEPGDNGALEDIAATPDGWIAVGSATPVGTTPEPRLLASSDGFEWSRRPAPQADDTSKGLIAVAVKGSSVVTTEQHSDGSALWRSGDGGFTWDLSQYEDASSSAHVEDLAVVAGGWMAVGSIRDDGATHGTVWRSTDGVTWTSSGNEPGLELDPPRRESAMTGVAASGDGVFTAGREGATCVEMVADCDLDPVVWFWHP